MNIDVVKMIEEADMILVGLGEEFDQRKKLKERGLEQARDYLQANDVRWMLPEVEEYLRDPDEQVMVIDRLGHLEALLSQKNYFVISTAFAPAVRKVAWKSDRLVTPCYGYRKKQCIDSCDSKLLELTSQDEDHIRSFCEKLVHEQTVTDWMPLGVCEDCGKPYVMNNILAPAYDENGYLPEWNLYTKWLQGTLNKKLLVLELGVGMQYPSVIRWPFEKIAFFNQKATFVRVHESLYQLSEDLSGKGFSISQNSIDWLGSLC